MLDFISVLGGYLIQILPALLVGFFLSGLIDEFIPASWVEKKLGGTGFYPVLFAGAIATLLPVCCWGSLPLAVSFYKKGSRLGPVLAFLVAAPATSVTALLLSFNLLGAKFAFFEFSAVILMAITLGLIIDKLKFSFSGPAASGCLDCQKVPAAGKKSFKTRIKAAVKFGFWDMPARIGKEIFLGIILASVVASVAPVGGWIKRNLTGGFGYLFAFLFGLIIYICSTATVPSVDAFINQGLGAGAGMVILLLGPVTSYGTILVLKKEFGNKILLIYLGFISVSALALGYVFSFI